ncbi:MAG: tetratricopeptide repeat protein [bacterium]
MDKKKLWSLLGSKKGEDQEIEALRAKIAERPDDPRLHQRLAELLLEKGKKKEAREAFVKAAECHAEAGFYLRAIATYRRILRMEESPEILLKLAELYLSNGLLGDALAQYKKAIHYYKSKGKSHEILGALRRMGELAPASLEVRLKYIELLRSEGFLNQAFEELVRLSEEAREGSDMASRAHLQQQLCEVAKALEESLVSQGRQRELAILKERVGELTATEDLLPTTPEGPESPWQQQSPQGEMMVEIQQEPVGTPEQSSQARAEKAEISLEEFSIRIQEAKIYEEQGLLEEAEEIYLELLRVDPGCWEAQDGLQRIQQEKAKLGHPQAAGDLKKLQQVEAEQRQLSEPQPQVSLSLKDAKAHYDLGLSFKELGLLDEAISELGTASSHPKMAFFSYREMGLCYRQKGEMAEAIDYLRKAIQCKGATKAQLLEAGYELARTLEQQGKRKEALILYRKIQEQEQGFRDIEERVKILSQ